MSAQRNTQVWRWLFLLTAIEAIAAAASALVIAPESTGISLARLVSLLVFAAFLTAGVAFASRPPAWTRKAANSLAVALAGLIFIALAAGLFLLRYLDPERLLPYYDRLGVLLTFLLITSLQALVVLLVSCYGMDLGRIRDMKGVVKPALVASGALFSVWLIVCLTRLGLIPDNAYWGETGVPILGWQLIISLLGGLAVLLGSRFRRRAHAVDLAIAAGIWAFAVAIWLSVPNEVLQNSFYAPIRPPSAQPFPNSDAGYYDSMAQSLIIGYPYQGEIPSRPLYIVVLAALHALVGERYDLIIVGQTMILALIPVLLYALGLVLHGRAAGVIAAMAAVSREWTTLLISSETRVSNSKMLLVDLPTMLLVLAACVLTVRWLQRKSIREAVVAGGVSGTLLLLRTQAAAILPLVGLLAVLVLGPRRRAAYLKLAAFAAAVALTVLPWLAHNYLIHGEFSMEAAFQYRIVASQYRYTGNLDIGNVELDGKSLAGTLLAFALRDPGFVVGFIANHAMATQLGGILALPLFHQYNGLFEEMNLYWLNWNGSLSLPNAGLVAMYLGLIGLGVGSSWARLRWVGLVPLGFSLAYSLSNGVARFSGWRYDLPADWIAYFYFAIGAAELLTILASLFGFRSIESHHEADGLPGPAHSYKPIIGLYAAFFVIGALPWFAALIAPPRYAGSAADELAARLSGAPALSQLEIDDADVAAFRQSPEAVLDIGRALYPRFFTRGNGLASAHPWPSYAPRDFPRLGFILQNESRHDVVLPMKVVPWDFEHSADVIVLGCNRGDYIEARLVLLEDAGIAFQGQSLAEPCP